jgi:serine/threonine protein kinase/Tol biopolymer transport system component
MRFAPNTRFGPYTIASLLGAGGMGEVYRARDERLHRFVALKFLPPLASDDPDARSRLQDEARAAAALDHPYICKVFEVGEIDGHAFIAMECVTGTTLATRLVKGPLSLKQALAVAVEVAEALAAAHRAGVLHRDLKPSNVMLAEDGHIKVLDFGLASRLTREVFDVNAATETSPAADTVTTRGTLGYMAPEQLRKQPVDARSDVFAFGVMLYELLTARRAFDGRSSFETVAAILDKDPAPWPASHEPPLLLQHIVRKTLAKDPEDRYQTMRDVLTDLRAVVADSSSGSRTQSAAVDAAVAAHVAAANRRWLSRVAIATVAILAVSAGTWWFLNRDSGPALAPSHRQVTVVGDVWEADLSHDGRSLAYTRGLGTGTRLIVQDVGGSATLELVSATTISRPRWLPKDDRISFSATMKQPDGSLKTGTFVVPRLGGQPTPFVSVGSVAWSPDASLAAIASEVTRGFRIVKGTDGTVIREVPVPEMRFIIDLDWHPRTNQIAVLGRDEQGRFVIATLSQEGKDKRQVAASKDTMLGLRWSSRTSVIYSQLMTNEAAEVVAVDATARTDTAPRVLLSGIPRGDSLSVSQDDRILLSVRETSTANLYAVDIGQTPPTVRPFTTGTSQVHSPRLSPDGAWIVATAGQGEHARIVKLPTGGGDLVPLTTGESLDAHPVWSPDGKRIAFGSRRNGSSGIWTMSADGLLQKQVDLGPVSVNITPAWLPDGRIAWQQSTPDNFITFMVRSLEGGASSRLTRDDARGFVFEPRFSPKGEAVAVFWNLGPGPGKPTGLYVIAWPARTERLLLAGRYSPLGWSPDGQWVYARKHNEAEIWKISVVTGQAFVIAKTPGIMDQGEPGGVVTLDGRTIIVSVTDRKADAWLVEHFDPRVR